MLRFEEPHVRRLDSYRDPVREAGEPLVPFVLGFPSEDFDDFLSQLRAVSQGKGLPPGFVADTTYWLVDGDTVVAVSNLRHELTEGLRREGGHIGYGVRPSARRRGHASRILRETLMRAAERGITDVVLTYAKNNTGSVRKIVRAGGVLVSEELLPERGEVVQRYLISLNAPATAP